jgi:putative flippase GtrA
MIGQELRAPIKFAVVGVANTFVGLSAIYLRKWLLGFGDAISNTCGYSIGLALSFILNREWTLGTPSSASSPRAFPRNFHSGLPENSR